MCLTVATATSKKNFTLKFIFTSTLFSFLVMALLAEYLIMVFTIYLLIVLFLAVGVDLHNVPFCRLACILGECPVEKMPVVQKI